MFVYVVNIKEGHFLFVVKLPCFNALFCSLYHFNGYVC